MAQIFQKEASAGLLVGVRERGKPAVLLQERAAHDSYARACQVTTHGKLTTEELALDESAAFSAALGRKLREELGEVAAQRVEACSGAPVELERVVNAKGRLVVTRGIDLGQEARDFQGLVVPGRDVGGFRVCTSPENLQELEPGHKTAGVPQAETRMFADEILAIRKFFAAFFG